MNCETALLMLHAFVDGELSAPDRALVDQHLSECPSCHVQLAKIQELDGVLKRALHPPAREPAVERVLQSIHRISESIDPISPDHAPRRIDRDSRLLRGENDLTPRGSARKTTAGTMFVLAITLLIVFVVVVQMPKENPAVAEITMATGSIDVRRSDHARWTAVKGPSVVSLPANARIRTRVDSLCEIRTKSDAIVRLNHATELVVRRPEQIELVTGELWCRTPSTTAMEISSVKTSSRVGSEATFTCPTSSESQWQTTPSNPVSCVGVSSTPIEVAVKLSHENCTVSPGETVSFVAGTAPAKSGYSDRLVARAWQLPLLLLKNPRDPELRQRLTELLAAAGHSKMAYLYDEQIRQLGPPGTLPLIAFVRSSESREQPELRHNAMRIIADLAPRSAEADLKALSNDDDPSVKQFARVALKRLVPDWNDTPAARE